MSKGRDAGGVYLRIVHPGVWRPGRVKGIWSAVVVGVVCACSMGSAESSVAATRCPNEEFRTGPSANLPDCRAYELVTPEELGRTQALTFTGSDLAIPSANGEHLALKTFAPLEPDPSYAGTRAVFSRTAQGWTAKSLVAPGAAAHQIEMPTSVLNPELSQVAFTSYVFLNQEESPYVFQVGPVGGRYSVMAETPGRFTTFINGANAGTVSVPSFADVLFESKDHQLLPSGPERTIAEEAGPGAFDLYDWTGGELRLVNLAGEGSHVEPLDTCGGGQLGGGTEDIGPAAVGAVSADGSKIFFTSCGRLYMRVDGSETVEVSAPQSVQLNPGERRGALFNAASADGQEVVFNTATPLLAGETTNENKLFIYNTATRKLQLVASGLAEVNGTGSRDVLLSEDGSVVYYKRGESIYRFEVQTGRTSFVAVTHTPSNVYEASYTTPNGQFLVFASGDGGVEVAGPHGLELEARGAARNDLYRYDAADGSVMCVSCGEGVAPAKGFMEDLRTSTTIETDDETPPFIQMSENGEKVFFETTAQLVPQDTNSPESEGNAGFAGMDVYEWEAEGVEEEPGVVCYNGNGCTHLISTGEDVGQATFLGASENGDNVFFATAAQLVPQATPEFPNIYDARVDGGFAPPQGEHGCSSCQGVGSTQPLFGPGASGTFVGAGNPTLPEPILLPPPKRTTKCPRGKKLSKGKCVKVKPKKKAKKGTRGAKR